MEHIAVMRKTWGLLEKILSGEKTIESRWYMHKRAPWNCIKGSEIVYFKNSGKPVTVRARAARVMQFSNLTPAGVKSILHRYGNAIGIAENVARAFYRSIKHKKYCIFVLLKDAEGVKPFEIDKKGFGAMSAWICVDTVSKLKKRRHSMENNVKLGVYEHYKGNRYEVIGVAKHSETLEEMVVYRKLYDDHGLWVRPLAMFLEDVEVDGKKMPRFRYMGNGAA